MRGLRRSPTRQVAERGTEHVARGYYLAPSWGALRNAGVLPATFDLRSSHEVTNDSRLVTMLAVHILGGRCLCREIVA